jgi:NitT/TauT family transport system permease protein
MRSRERKLSKENKLMARVAFMIALLAIWEIIARSGRFPDALFPGLMDILKSFIDLLKNGELIMKTAYSIGVVFLAMAISLVLAAGLAVISRVSGYARELLLLLQSILSPLPGIAVLPIVILWLGVSRTSMVLIMVHATIWPLWSQLDLSIERLGTRYGRFMEAFRLDRKTRFWHIYVQGSAEDLKSSLGISWSRGWRALISVEMVFGMVGTRTGLGWLIFERRMYMDTPGLLAGLVTIAICGILFESLLFKGGRAYEAY